MVFTIVILLIGLLLPIGTLAVCSCSQDTTVSPVALNCLGDSQTFIGDTQLYIGTWVACTSTSFDADFEVSPFGSNQTLHIPSGGSLEVTGNLSIPETGQFTVMIVADDLTNNSTLEVFGNLIVDGSLNIVVATIVIHGNVIVSPMASLYFLTVSTLDIRGSISTQGNLIFEGNPNNTNNPVSIGGSLSGIGVETIQISRVNVSVQGSINATNAELIITPLTLTSLSAKTVAVQSVQLIMGQPDMGESNFGVSFQIIRSSPCTFPNNFVQNWTCGSYRVNDTISTTQGLSLIIHGQNLTTKDSDYCCFRNLDLCTCASVKGSPMPQECQVMCQGLDCDTAGVVIGWIIGAILILAILSVACTLFLRDFLATE